MTPYRVVWKRSAVKELRALSKDAVERIVRTVEQLSANPYGSEYGSWLVRSTLTAFEKEITGSSTPLPRRLWWSRLFALVTGRMCTTGSRRSLDRSGGSAFLE